LNKNGRTLSVAFLDAHFQRRPGRGNPLPAKLPKEPIEKELCFPLLIAFDVRANPRNKFSQPLRSLGFHAGSLLHDDPIVRKYWRALRTRLPKANTERRIAMGFDNMDGGSLRTRWAAPLMRILGAVCAGIVGVWFLLSLLSRFPSDSGGPVLAAGIVIDEGGLPVTGASVALLPPSVEATTNDAGYFRTSFANVDGSISTYVLEVKKSGEGLTRRDEPILPMGFLRMQAASG
jgi:hypothetical protein